MLSTKSELRVENNEDVNALVIPENQHIDSFHLDVKEGHLDNENFNKLFNQVAKANLSNHLHLDLSHIQNWDDQKINTVSGALKHWNLKNLAFHLSDTKLSDDQFQTLLGSFQHMSNLEKLDISLENVNMNNKKKKFVDSLTKKFPKLNNLRVNIRRNEMTKEDIKEIEDFMSDIPYRFLYW